MARLSETLSMFAGRHEGPGLVADLADLVQTLKTMFNPYRPERHYMRGPGPKWHERHDPAPALVTREA